MGRSIWGYVYVLFYVGLAILLLAAPILFFGFAADASRARKIGSGVLSYVVAAVIVGFAFYHAVPADYTRDLSWHWPPRSSSLGAIHGEYLERLENPNVIAPENAPPIRQMIERERNTFLRRWAGVTLLGGVGVAVMTWLVWRIVRGRRRQTLASADSQR